jgi:hypothetical protein
MLYFFQQLFDYLSFKFNRFSNVLEKPFFSISFQYYHLNIVFINIKQIFEEPSQDSPVSLNFAPLPPISDAALVGLLRNPFDSSNFPAATALSDVSAGTDAVLQSADSDDTQCGAEVTL